MQRIDSTRTDDQAIDVEIQTKSFAPRVTPADIEANIVSEHYFTAADGANGAQWIQLMDEHTGEIRGLDAFVPPMPLTLLTFCVLVLRNGFTVTGESACASPENFDEPLGRKIARANAVNKIWPLMGYELRTRLAGQAGVDL